MAVLWLSHKSAAPWVTATPVGDVTYPSKLYCDNAVYLHCLMHAIQCFWSNIPNTIPTITPKCTFKNNGSRVFRVRWQLISFQPFQPCLAYLLLQTIILCWSRTFESDRMSYLWSCRIRFFITVIIITIGAHTAVWVWKIHLLNFSCPLPNNEYPSITKDLIFELNAQILQLGWHHLP